MDDQEFIDALRVAFDQAQEDLIQAVRDACPGPHVVRQHRDGRPPWCPRCHRTEMGTPVP